MSQIKLEIYKKLLKDSISGIKGFKFDYWKQIFDNVPPISMPMN